VPKRIKRGGHSAAGGGPGRDHPVPGTRHKLGSLTSSREKEGKEKKKNGGETKLNTSKTPFLTFPEEKRKRHPQVKQVKERQGKGGVRHTKKITITRTDPKKKHKKEN